TPPRRPTSSPAAPPRRAPASSPSTTPSPPASACAARSSASKAPAGGERRSARSARRNETGPNRPAAPQPRALPWAKATPSLRPFPPPWISVFALGPKGCSDLAQGIALGRGCGTLLRNSSRPFLLALAAPLLVLHAAAVDGAGDARLLARRLFLERLAQQLREALQGRLPVRSLGAVLLGGHVQNPGARDARRQPLAQARLLLL